MSFRDNMFSILATLLVLGVEIPTEGEERGRFFDTVERNSFLIIGFCISFLFTLSQLLFLLFSFPSFLLIYLFIHTLRITLER